jgi:hypothetical protein
MTDTKKTAARATKPAAPVAAGPYRTNDAWTLAHGTAVAAYRKDPVARATMTVLTHLAWRAPAATVAWHKGTSPTMVAHAATLGVDTGVRVADAVALAVASLPDNDAKAPLADAAKALHPATTPAKK